ncbi:putative xylanase/chitin deacetylase [Desulfitobacterium dichloroeliminans LMG P-21439]|uniref:Putative xylanase/chitin deacetylase n=1 Tax=Desulfitobacterium dichloroeliminans (strain LMG P-21439 / DCA1) TaxID=871963 RepID=L0F7Y0_DESDL|nr:polysaccharide deacetylase family protein [Desulfitobacterium dichloroeliminans]AGA69939.1 putative xylanase/chitin deacetylase [Desulfitobacterium dichloroeliminans LMG P-21439]
MSRRMRVRKGVFCLVLVVSFLAVLISSGCSSVQSNPLPLPQESVAHEVLTPEQNNTSNQTEAVSQNVNPSSSEDSMSASGESMSSSEDSMNTNEDSTNASGNRPNTLAVVDEAIPVLYYHSIAYEAGNELRIPPQEFEAHMQLLYDNGYESVTLNELYLYFYEDGVLPKKPFVITFDDGYEDNYTQAFPIADKFGYNGTIFMVTDWIDGKGYLKQEQLLEMSQAGWQIESHTKTHPYLNSISNEQIKEELSSSKKALEKLLGTTVNVFAYPYGINNPTIIELCKEAGYKLGLTIERGWAAAEDPFRIQRIYCYANMGLAELKRRIENPYY